MHDISATCPLCRSTNVYGAELIGRYTLCTSCRGRFYIEVPPLAESQGKAALVSEPIGPAGPAGSTTLDDLLWDTQQGNRFVIQSLRRVEGRLRWHSYALGGILVLLAGRLLMVVLKL